MESGDSIEIKALNDKAKEFNKKTTGIQEFDFAEIDLTSAEFDDCDLALAVFNRSILDKTGFRTSYNFSIDPEINRIKKV